MSNISYVNESPPPHPRPICILPSARHSPSLLCQLAVGGGKFPSPMRHVVASRTRDTPSVRQRWFFLEFTWQLGLFVCAFRGDTLVFGMYTVLHRLVARWDSFSVSNVACTRNCHRWAGEHTRLALCACCVCYTSSYHAPPTNSVWWPYPLPTVVLVPCLDILWVSAK